RSDVGCCVVRSAINRGCGDKGGARLTVCGGTGGRGGGGCAGGGGEMAFWNGGERPAARGALSAENARAEIGEVGSESEGTSSREPEEEIL
ncbi:hypothetical protein AML91_00165, partial [Paenibacillus jilunlii]